MKKINLARCVKTVRNGHSADVLYARVKENKDELFFDIARQRRAYMCELRALKKSGFGHLSARAIEHFICLEKSNNIRLKFARENAAEYKKLVGAAYIRKHFKFW